MFLFVQVLKEVLELQFMMKDTLMSCWREKNEFCLEFEEAPDMEKLEDEFSNDEFFFLTMGTKSISNSL